MKTWRQLEAMAKRQGLTLKHGSWSWSATDSNQDYVVGGDRWAGPRVGRGRVMRVMAEAALKQMRSKP